VALVSPVHLDRIWEVMIDGGSERTLPLPAVNEGSSVGVAPLLDVDPGGTIAFRERVPSIFLRAEIDPFTELRPDGGARLTQASLRRGAQRGLTADAVIERLQALAGSPIPDEVQRMVQQWGRDWGRGALGTVSLLQMESEDAA